MDELECVKGRKVSEVSEEIAWALGGGGVRGYYMVENSASRTKALGITTKSEGNLPPAPFAQRTIDKEDLVRNQNKKLKLNRDLRRS